MTNDEAIEYILQLVGELEDVYDDWKPLQTRADERAYDVLGRIHEKAASIDADDMKRSALVDLLRNHDEVKGSKWSPNSKSAADLLVTNLLGLKTARTRKHNWLAALSYAETCGVERTSAAFKEWIKSPAVGGIDGAVDHVRGVTDSDGDEEASIGEAVQKLESELDDPETLGLAVPEDAPEGIAVLVVRRVSDTESTILKRATDKAKIMRVFLDLGIMSKRKKWTPIRVANAESTALYSLNRVVKKAFDGTDFSKKDPSSFMFAVKKLKSVPELRAKYFESEPCVKATVADAATGNFGVIEVQNPDFDVLDPGAALSVALGRGR